VNGIVRVHRGSVTDALGVDAVINACNPELGLGSGVSGAILAECGAGFQRDVRERLADELDAPLGPDDCLSTGAGPSERFRWVLHVASVDYRRPDPETGAYTGPARIRRCMAAALGEATWLAGDHGITALAIAAPLLGAGHGGLGPAASLEAMMTAIRGHIDDRGWALGELVIACPEERDARLVAPAAIRFGVPLIER
jgi:O-acetyl-ADP-ribose deacetylase (regulator of RNase III)